jgi:hypothetical protein
VVSRVIAVLDDVGIPYAIGGSFASSVHGFPRTTNDIDLVADIRAEHVQRLVELLAKDFYVEPDAVTEAIRVGTSFNLINHETVFKVDVFVCAEHSFRKAQLSHAGMEHVRGVCLRVLSPEDTILAKLQWYRQGGGVSERQWRDVVEVLLVQGERLDLHYLRGEAERMGLGGLLARAMGDVGAGLG